MTYLELVEEVEKRIGNIVVSDRGSIVYRSRLGDELSSQLLRKIAVEAISVINLVSNEKDSDHD